jgi:hypothetical protein
LPKTAAEGRRRLKAVATEDRRENEACSIEAYSNGFCGSATSGLSLPRARLVRASEMRSKSWTMRLRCFFSAAAAVLRRTGGESFSNVKAGIVFPLVVELRHPGVSLHFHFISLSAV